MTAENIALLKEIFNSKSKIVLTVHTNPDGDALGSALALNNILLQLGNNAVVVAPNSFPGFLSWMSGTSEILVFDQQPKHVKEVIQEADYIFSLDYNAPKRSGNLCDFIAKSPSFKVMIDHHIDPDNEFYDLSFSKLTVSSTAELVYELLESMQLLHMITKEIAESIYVGIMTDTGSYSFSLRNPATFSISAHLISLGVDGEKVHRLVYDTFSENRLRLLGHAINNCMMVMDAYKTAIITLSLRDLNRFNYQIGDTEGLVNYPLSMENINFAILVTERKDQIRLSFRSKGSFSVNDFARNHFEGGGHHNAAGGNDAASLKETVSKLLSLLPQYVHQLDYTYA